MRKKSNLCQVLFALYLAWALCDASPAPQAEWVPTKEITKYGTDEVILVNEDNIDINVRKSCHDYIGGCVLFH